MVFTCSAVQYGIPVLYDVENFQDFLHSCCESFMSHIVDGHGVCRTLQTTPPDSDLASPEVQCKSVAASSFPASDAHVVLFCQSSDRASAVNQCITQLLPGTRLTA